MEGPKRLEFTTLGPPGKKEKKDATPKTYRFNLDIPESTDTTCPEFFYTELLKTIPGAEDKPKSSVDPFDDDDADKLAAIAKSFEDKYNKAGAGKKKRKKKWQDNYYLEQLGEGYDENDTFIDNSEAYDEVLPETMTTKLGGFYINSGRLELKEMSDSSEDEFRSPLPVKKNKKRRISSDEDSDGEKVVKKKKIKDSLSVDGEVKKKKKKKLIIPPGEKPVKKVKIKDKVKDGKSNAVSALIKTTSPNLNGESVENGVISSDSDSSNETKSQMKSNISMVIDSVIAMSANESNSRGDFEDSMPKKDIDLESVPKLPPALPQGMEDKIEQLKNLAMESRDGKCKFFTDDVNKQLLEVEMASKQMSVGNRSAMFGHLAAFLPCSKDTLLKRAKTLRVKELEDKIKEPLDKLKEAVNRIMPALIEKFEEDSKKAALEKLEDGNKEPNKEDKEKEAGKEDAATESDEEEKTNQSDVSKKRQTGPRKKFVWDGEVRSLLCDVVRVKMHTYLMSKGKSQTAEEFCKNFLEQDVRPIWPKGWMQTRVLYKESRAAHSLWTNPQKGKKPLLVSKAQAATVTNQISKSPNIPVTSTPSSSKPPYVTVTKINSGNGAIKTASVNINNGKPVTSSQQTTPNTIVKKIVPTLLDFANSNSGGTSLSSSNLSLIKSTLQGSADIPAPSMIKISDMRLPGANKTDSSWDHMVSDILRSSMGSDQPSRQSPPKPVVQRQNSNSSSQAASGYMAQFAKYVHSQDSVVPTTQVSPDKKLADTQMLLNEQRKKLAQQQKMHIEAEKQRQIKLLNAHKLDLEEKEKQYTHKIAMQLASAQNAAFMQKQRSKSGDQPKIPSQSPMSLAMSKTIPVGQGGQSSSRKQLVGQFKAGNGQHKHLSDNLIRQQLNENSKGSPMLQQVKTMQKQPGGSFVQVSPTSDSLRKPSPQSQTVKIQGKPGSQHIVTLNNSQSQGQVLFSPGVTVTTNSRPASSLLKTLFGQAQAQTSSQSFPVPSIQRSSVQGTPSPKVTSPHGQPQHRWSPNSSIQELQARLQSAAGMQSKPYTIPVTSPQAVPGYQSVKLSSLTPEHLQSYQAVQQLRSPTYNKQMSAPDGSK